VQAPDFSSENYLLCVLSMDSMANAYCHAVPIAPDDPGSAHHGTGGAQNSGTVIRRADTHRLRCDRIRQGRRGRRGHRRKNERSNHGKTEQKMGKFDAFHKDDPPFDR
jgi:hypothetical protein